MKVAIYGRTLNTEHTGLVQQLFDLLHSYGFTAFIFAPYVNELRDHIHFKQDIKSFATYDDIKDKVDYIISLGGDGTLLDAVALVRNSGIPIMGINIGRLGFLANTPKEDLTTAMESLRKRSYQVDERSLIHLDSNKPIFKDMNYGLNEFSIHKKDTSSMITIHTYINGELLNSYWADGLIVSTPTGSTGYSLSCGGPIVFPESETFVITPVAPHNLNVRPIIVPDDAIISFEVEGRNENFLCTLDSRYETIDSSFQLAVRKESFKVNLLRINDTNFMHTLRSKLHWGADNRN